MLLLVSRQSEDQQQLRRPTTTKVISINVFDKSPIENLFDKPIQQNVKEPFPSNQLNIFE